MDLSAVLQQPLTFRKKVFKLVGKEISVLDPQENLVLYVKQKAFKLKEDIRVYSEKEMINEKLYIQARQILDFKAAYDVIDAVTKEKIGTLRRKGWSSIIRDEWQILDTNDQQIGTITEDSMGLALVRRFLTNLVPQSYDFKVGETSAAQLKQRFNPFVFKADFTVNGAGLDPRLALAGAVLLMSIEGRQN